MTSIPATWGSYSLSITIDAGLVGQILQFGFENYRQRTRARACSTTTSSSTPDAGRRPRKRSWGEHQGAVPVVDFADLAQRKGPGGAGPLLPPRGSGARPHLTSDTRRDSTNRSPRSRTR